MVIFLLLQPQAGMPFFAGLLWYIHYLMFHFIKKLTPALTIINFLVCTVLIQLGCVDGYQT